MLGPGLKKIDKHSSIVECRCSVDSQDVIDIIPGVTFYIFVVKLTAASACLQSCIIGMCASIVPSCIIDVGDSKLSR